MRGDDEAVIGNNCEEIEPQRKEVKGSMLSRLKMEDRLTQKEAMTSLKEIVEGGGGSGRNTSKVLRANSSHFPSLKSAL